VLEQRHEKGAGKRGGGIGTASRRASEVKNFSKVRLGESRESSWSYANSERYPRVRAKVKSQLEQRKCRAQAHATICGIRVAHGFRRTGTYHQGATQDFCGRSCAERSLVYIDKAWYGKDSPSFVWKASRCAQVLYVSSTGT